MEFWAANCEDYQPRKRQESLDLGGFYSWSLDSQDRYLDGLADYALSLSTPQDRHHGQDWPLVRTLEDLGQVRFASRLVCAVSPLAQGAVGGMRAYTVGPGFTHRATLREDIRKQMLRSQSEADDQKWNKLCAMVQTRIDAFKRRVRWEDWQKELFSRAVEDGEYFLREHIWDRQLEVRVIEPEQVRPYPGWRENGSFGILTEWGDVLRVQGYGVCWDGIEWEAIPASEVYHHKRNVVRNVKRGRPDFAYNTNLLLKTAGKLLYAMGMGSSIQACIAFIRSHETGTRAEVEDLAHEHTELTRENPYSGQTEYHTRYEPGTVLDTGKGTVYNPPPYGSAANLHVAVATALCQGIAARNNLPLWMVNGDSSNANFASSVVAESPFVRNVEVWQADLKRLDEVVLRRALEVDVIYGRLPAEALEYVEVQSVPPSLVTRKPAEEAQLNQAYLEMRVKSPQTIQQELSLDTDQEAANFRLWDQQQPKQKPPEEANPQQQGAVGEGPEHTAESWDEEKHPRDHGKFSSKPGAKGGGEDSASKGGEKPHHLTKAEFSSKPLVLEVGKGFPAEVYHGTITKSAQAFMSGTDLDERDRSTTLSEFGSGVIYTAEPTAPHQALMFGSGKSQKGARTLIAMKLKGGAKVLDLSPYMTRRPTIGSTDKPVLDIQSPPSFTEDMRDWLVKKREARGLASVAAERIDRVVNPDNPDFSVEEYAGLLPGYARDRGYAAFRLPDETIIVDRSAIESARKVPAKERAALEAQAERTRSARTKHSLYTDHADVNAKERVHRAHVEDALASGEEVPAEVLKDYPDLAKKHGRTHEDVTWDESKHARDHGKFASKPGAKGEKEKPGHKPPTPAQHAHAQKQIARTADMGHHQAAKVLGEYARLHRDSGKHGLAQLYADAATQRMKQHYDVMLQRKHARWDEDDPAYGRPTTPDERHPDRELPRTGEYKEPPKPLSGDKEKVKNLSKTAIGDMTEALLSKLNLRPIMPPGTRQNPLDAEADHSGQAFEIKACTTAAKEFKAKPKKEEVEAKQAYAQEHGLKTATLIAVVDYDKQEVHAYWRDGIGAFSLTPNNLHEWNYGGTVSFSDADVKLWDRQGKKKKAKEPK